MFVSVIAYVYPGINKTGVAVVQIVNGVIKKVAIGSVENEVLPHWLEILRPTEMVVSDLKFHSEEHSSVPMPNTVKTFTIARPGWEKQRVPLFLDGKRRHGVYMHNVAKMAFRDLVRRRIGLSGWKVERLDREWVMKNKVLEIGRAKR